MKKVLILGAGMVSGPVTRYLLEKGFYVTLADINPDKSEAIIAGHTSGKAIQWNADDEEKLDGLIKEHDLIISLLPYDISRQSGKAFHKAKEEYGYYLLCKAGNECS